MKDFYGIGSAPAALPVSDKHAALKKVAAQITEPSAAEPRIAITPKMWVGLRDKLKAVGNPGQYRIMHAIEACEKAQNLATADINEENVKYIIKMRASSVRKSHWDSIHAALDRMHAQKIQAARGKITISAPMYHRLTTQLRAKGGIQAARILNAVTRYETMNDYKSTGLRLDTVRRVIRAPGEALPKEQWRRMKAALEIVPDRAVLVPISTIAQEKLAATWQAKGKPVAGRILLAVRAYEKGKALEPSSLTRDVIEVVIKGEQDTIREGCLERILDGLATMNDCMTLSAAQHKDFLARISAMKKAMPADAIKGVTDHDIVMRAVETYERVKNLDPVGLGRDFVNALISGKRGGLEEKQWQRLGQALANFDPRKLRQAAQVVTSRQLIEQRLERTLVAAIRRAKVVPPSQHVTPAG